MVKAIKNALGKDLKKWEFFSYPISSRGVGTLYKKQRTPLFLCAPWVCYNLGNEPNKDGEEWLTMKGFADVGAGAPIQIEQDVTNKWGLDFALPKIYDVLNLDINVGKTKSKNINVKMGKAYIRNIYPDSVQNYVVHMPGKNSVKKAFNESKLLMVASDLVIKGIEITIELEPDFSSKIDAKIGLPSGDQEASKMFQDAKLALNVSRKSKGKYIFKFEEPLVVARYVIQQQNGGFYSAPSSIDSLQYLLNIDESNPATR